MYGSSIFLVDLFERHSYRIQVIYRVFHCVTRERYTLQLWLRFGLIWFLLNFRCLFKRCQIIWRLHGLPFMRRNLSKSGFDMDRHSVPVTIYLFFINNRCSRRNGPWKIGFLFQAEFFCRWDSLGDLDRLFFDELRFSFTSADTHRRFFDFIRRNINVLRLGSILSIALWLSSIRRFLFYDIDRRFLANQHLIFVWLNFFHVFVRGASERHLLEFHLFF